MEINKELKVTNDKLDEESPKFMGSSEDLTSDMKKIESTFYANEDITIDFNK